MGRPIGNDTVITSTQAATEPSFTSSVFALHCSLSSGHQWSRLAGGVAARGDGREVDAQSEIKLALEIANETGIVSASDAAI
jgi:hypothetical protein